MLNLICNNVEPDLHDVDPALPDAGLVLVLAGLARVDGLRIAGVPGQRVHVTRHNNWADRVISSHLGPLIQFSGYFYFWGYYDMSCDTARGIHYRTVRKVSPFLLIVIAQREGRDHHDPRPRSNPGPTVR